MGVLPCGVPCGMLQEQLWQTMIVGGYSDSCGEVMGALAPPNEFLLAQVPYCSIGSIYIAPRHMQGLFHDTVLRGPFPLVDRVHGKSWIGMRGRFGRFAAFLYKCQSSTFVAPCLSLGVFQ